MPKVSVIIPCYNQGQYLDQAVNSVLCQSFTDFEIIVINDGSTDEYTIHHLATYQKEKTKIYHIENQGVSAARNFGISHATGEYILPLDADDKIDSTYMEKAVAVLDSRPEIGIVYCNAHFFGAKNCRWKLSDFDMRKMLISNIIFCSAFFRKADWEKVNGYNVNMKQGWEDWDFWLSLLALGIQVHQLPEYLFHYRIKKQSRSTQIIRRYDEYARLHTQVFQNHKEFFCRNIDVLFDEYYKLIDQKNTTLHKIAAGLADPLKAINRLFINRMP